MPEKVIEKVKIKLLVYGAKILLKYIPLYQLFNF